MIRTPLVPTRFARGNYDSASGRRLQFAEINKMNVSSTIRSDFQNGNPKEPRLRCRTFKPYGKRVLPAICC